MGQLKSSTRSYWLAPRTPIMVLGGWLLLLPLLIYWYSFAAALPSRYRINEGFLYWDIGSSPRRLDLATGQLQNLTLESGQWLLPRHDKDLVTVRYLDDRNEWEVCFLDPGTMKVLHRRSMGYPPGNTLVASRFLVSVRMDQEGVSVLEVVDIFNDNSPPMQLQWHGDRNPRFRAIPDSTCFLYCSVSGEVCLYKIESNQVRVLATWNASAIGDWDLLCDAQRIISLSPDRTHFEYRSTLHGSLMARVVNSLGLEIREYGGGGTAMELPSLDMDAVSPSRQLGLKFSFNPHGNTGKMQAEIFDLQQGVLRQVFPLPLRASKERWNRSCFLNESMVAIRGRDPDGHVAVIEIETGQLKRIYRPEYWRCASWPWAAWGVLIWATAWLMFSVRRVGSAWFDVAMLVLVAMIISSFVSIGPWVQCCILLGLAQFSIWWMTTSSEPLWIRVLIGGGLMVLALAVGERCLSSLTPLYLGTLPGRGTYLLMATVLSSYTALLGVAIRCLGRRLSPPQHMDEPIVAFPYLKISIKRLLFWMTFAAIATACSQLLKYRMELFTHRLVWMGLVTGLASGVGLIAVWVSNRRVFHGFMILVFGSLWCLATLLAIPRMFQFDATERVLVLLGDVAEHFWPHVYDDEHVPMAIAMMASGIVALYSTVIFSLPFRLRGWGLREVNPKRGEGL